MKFDLGMLIFSLSYEVIKPTPDTFYILTISFKFLGCSCYTKTFIKYSALWEGNEIFDIFVNSFAWAEKKCTFVVVVGSHLSPNMGPYLTANTHFTDGGSCQGLQTRLITPLKMLVRIVM